MLSRCRDMPELAGRLSGCPHYVQASEPLTDDWSCSRPATGISRYQSQLLHLCALHPGHQPANLLQKQQTSHNKKYTMYSLCILYRVYYTIYYISVYYICIYTIYVYYICIYTISLYTIQVVVLLVYSSCTRTCAPCVQVASLQIIIRSSRGLGA